MVLAMPAMSVVMSSVTLSSHVKLTITPPADQVITLSISLTLDNVNQLEERLRAVSTPYNSKYGKYLDKDEVDALFPPSTDASNAVTSWCEQIYFTLSDNTGILSPPLRSSYMGGISNLEMI